MLLVPGSRGPVPFSMGSRFSRVGYVERKEDSVAWVSRGQLSASQAGLSPSGLLPVAQRSQPVSLQRRCRPRRSSEALQPPAPARSPDSSFIHARRHPMLGTAGLCWPESTSRITGNYKNLSVFIGRTTVKSETLGRFDLVCHCLDPII